MSYINPSIFREYDIRGREDDSELSVVSLELLGKACGTYLARKNIKTVVIGRDARATSEEFERAAIKGLLSAGMHVIDIGMVLTPMMYWAQYHFKAQGGFMVTASHNPKGWNGVKFSDDYSYTLTGDELKNVYKMIIEDDFDLLDGGKVSVENIKDFYIQDLVKRVSINKPFRIVVNTGNGTAGPFVPDLLRAAGCTVIEHLTTVDPAYPAYTPNPAEMDMMEDTGRVVHGNQADFGFAFDGDGDRLGLTDEEGTIIWPDRYAAFIARLILESMPGAKIIFDVKSSQALQEDISSHGGTSEMVKTGHSAMKKKLKEDPLVQLGAELSGHIFSRFRFFGHDDACFSALLLLEYFSKEGKPISELASTLPEYVSTPGYNAATPDDKKHAVIEQLISEFQAEGYDVITIDGVRVNFYTKNKSEVGLAPSEAEGWGLARVSNTSPNITLRFEAKTEKALNEIQNIFREKLSRYDFVAKEWKAG